MNPEQYCQEKCAASGSSFYYSFLFLPAERRRAIMALYAFCREVDDVVDECNDISIAATKLTWWRQEIERVVNGQPTHPVGLALKAVGGDFNLPKEQLLEQKNIHALIDQTHETITLLIPAWRQQVMALFSATPADSQTALYEQLASTQQALQERLQALNTRKDPS